MTEQCFLQGGKGRVHHMSTQQSNPATITKGVGRARVIGLLFLVGIFGLLLGTLIRPSEAAQNYEYRITNLERQLNQIQFTYNQLDRRISQIENQTYTARTQPSASQATSSDVNALAEDNRLANRRIDELQNQVQTQAKMINELHQMITGKKTPAKDEKPDEKQDPKKKPSLAGKPNP